MDAHKLYQILEKDFIFPELKDDWADYMGSISEYLCDNFKKRSMGLVCDFTTKINKVYTAVFPSKKVMQEILEKETQNALLFVHHPSIWDIRKAPEVFYQMDKRLLQAFKEKNISIYNLHVPLDNYGRYSTSNTLAKEIGIKIEKPFAPYFGSLCGVIGKTEYKTITDIKHKIETVLGHKIKVYQYGNEYIKDQKIAIIAGGGNDLEMISEINTEGINTFLTGIAIKNEHSKNEHEYLIKNKITIIGGTHYSTEKFACIKMTKYFENLGIEAEFIKDEPILEDM